MMVRYVRSKRRERQQRSVAPVPRHQQVVIRKQVQSSRSTGGRRVLRRRRSVYRPVRTLEAFERLQSLESLQAEAIAARAATRRPPTHRMIRVPAAGRARSARRVVAATTIGALSASTLIMQPAAALPGSPALQHHSPLAAPVITGLGQGSRGDAVRTLQQALIDAGITVVGGADGIYGPQTQASVERFQAQKGLPVTGVVDDATAAALSSASGGSTGSGGTAVPTGGGTYVGLSQGAQGAAVEAVQRALVDKGVWLPRISGTFDSSTVRGVRQFQGWNRLGVTGTITTATAKALGLDGSAPAPTTPSTPTTPERDEPPAQASGYVGLNRGDRGPLVADVQRALINNGVRVIGGADGVFGPKTQAALVSFQQIKGLAATGVVGAADVAALGLAGDQPATPPATDLTPPATDQFVGLAVGARGSAVKQLQQALIDAGVTVRGGADGIFGPVTKAALSQYQQAQGLTGSGVVDAATVDRLGLGSANGPQPYAPAPADHDHDHDHGDDANTTDSYIGLRRGNTGSLVSDLQKALRRFGLSVDADGQFGALTERALKAFQRVNGITETGVLTRTGARLLALGTVYDEPGTGDYLPFQMERFPVQGLCAFGDTWHAPRGGGRLHVGTDIIADEGKLLYAVVDGTISKMYWDQPGALAGNGVRVAQDDGTYFTYLHMQGFAPGIEVGTEVQAGDVIGWIGNTGSSATPHLHFEIHPGGGAAINPYPYLKAMDDCKNTTPQYQSSFAPSE